MTVNSLRRSGSRLAHSPVLTFRTHWPTVELLDGLAQLEGSSRSRIINAAITQYALDYFAARGRTPAGYFETRVRLMQVLLKRLQVNLKLEDKEDSAGLEEDRQQILEEACRYARYSRNQPSLFLLSKVTDWLAITFQNPLPADMTARTDEISALLETLMKTHATDAGEAEGSAGRAH